MKMKKLQMLLIVLALFIPVFTFAATSTPSITFDFPKIKSAYKTFDFLSFLKILNRGESIGGGAFQKQETKIDTSVSHESYIKQFLFPSIKSVATSTDIVEIATQIFGGEIKTKKNRPKNCISVEFKNSWSRGASGDEILILQKFLNQNSRTSIAQEGVGSSGKETKYFGAKTQDAVKRFQTLFAQDILESVGLSSATGFWGPSTIKKANEITALCR